MSREILQLADIVSPGIQYLSNYLLILIIIFLNFLIVPGLNTLREEWLIFKHTYLEIKITILKRRDCNYSEIEQISLLDSVYIARRCVDRRLMIYKNLNNQK